MDLEDLKFEQARRVNDARCIERLIHTEAFEHVYENLKDKKEILDLIIRSDRKGIDLWMSRQVKVDYSVMTLKELRIIGSRKGISYYNRLQKHVLLFEILELEHKKKMG